MRTIEADELKAKLDRGESFKLVMALNDWAFRAKRIPGSLNIHEPQKALQLLEPDDEIVVYCSNVQCPSSVMAYHFLVDQGYKNVRRFAGGLTAWEEAGYPMEGEMVTGA